LKCLNHLWVCVWPGASSSNASLSILCFRSHLAEYEPEFEANSLLLHISHFSRSVPSQHSTNTRSQKRTEETLISSQQSAAWQRYLAAHNCTTSGFRTAFQFQELLDSTS
jgi:hypothetical protein